MAIYPYTNAYQAYYPAVPDQLMQLRQNAMQPQNMQIAQPQPMQMGQPQPQMVSNGINWCQGEEGAKAYFVAPGNSVLLMDSDSSVFYIKSADGSGMPLPLRIFDYTERSAEQNEKKQVQAPQIDISNFVTRDELEEILSERLKRPAKSAKTKEDTENG